jgi:hypothetical protein
MTIKVNIYLIRTQLLITICIMSRVIATKLSLHYNVSRFSNSELVYSKKRFEQLIVFGEWL